VRIEGDFMGEAFLVNRKKIVSSPVNELVSPFDELSRKTRIPKTRLPDGSIEDLLKSTQKGTAESAVPFYKIIFAAARTQQTFPGPKERPPRQMPDQPPGAAFTSPQTGGGGDRGEPAPLRRN
jgi:hypothetical protein